MANQMRPSSNEEAPDPAVTYERAKPEREAGMGSLKAVKNPPRSEVGDKMEEAVPNRQAGDRQINAQETQPDHSMNDEEPMGSDQRPLEASKDSDRRFPRTGGKGGTPDAGEKPSQS